MTNYREILRLHHLGIPKKSIAESLRCSRTTVINAIRQAEAVHITWEQCEKLSDKQIRGKLFPAAGIGLAYKMPDFDYVHKELSKSGVTLSLLWVEYCESCKDSGEIPYQSTQFYKHYADYASKHRATMHINRKPGDIMEVDWAGQTAKIIDTDTGEDIDAYIFVSALSYSKYAYVEAFLRMNQETWITAHNHAYRFYGGVTKMLVPDNLKTGITKNTKEETVITKAYQEMAEHYDTAILPARIKRPKDKTNVEGEVGVVSTWILAAIRNMEFFSLRELNETIREKLKSYNEKTFQKKEGSRKSLYEEERIFLRPLPEHNFEIATWKTAKVQDNYHISCLGGYYSVPYEYIGKTVDVRITENAIEVLHSGTRICSHPKLKEHQGKYSTVEMHMPKEHQKYGQWNGDRFRNWADKFGANTRAVIDYLLSSVKIEQQAYKTCRALLHLSDKYTAERLESACSKVLSFTPYPSFRSVKAVLISGQDKIKASYEDNEERQYDNEHSFTRGAGYYKDGDE